MKNLSSVLLLCLAFVTGCAELPKAEITSFRSPGTDFKAIKSFYVSRDDEKTGGDEKHIRSLKAVKDSMASYGYPTTSGMLAEIPADAQCKVIIHDRWFWDMQWYLLSLDMKFYDQKTGELVASGHCRRADPTIRRPPEFIANELVEAILEGPAGSH